MSEEQPKAPQPANGESSETPAKPESESVGERSQTPADASPDAATQTLETAAVEVPDTSAEKPQIVSDLKPATGSTLDSSEPAEPSLAETATKVWQEVQPKLKTQTVKVLRFTIQTLEKAVEKLETEPDSASTDTSEAALPGATAESLDTSGSLGTKATELWSKLRPVWQRLQAWWAVMLPKIRARLPESLNQQLSDSVLTGAIAVVAVFLLWITSGLFSGKPEPAQVAVRPAPAPVASPIKKPAPPVSQPTPPAGRTPASPKPAPASSPAPKASPTPVSSPVPKTNPTPQPSVSPVAKPSPPALKLTPEQKLIARIQNQVAEISDQYVSGLIQSVQANFRGSQLIVKVGDGWYSLSRTQQDKLANEILRRAQQLNFSKLELSDPEGTLLARSPVVGAEMIVVKRINAPQKPS